MLHDIAFPDFNSSSAKRFFKIGSHLKAKSSDDIFSRRSFLCMRIFPDYGIFFFSNFQSGFFESPGGFPENILAASLSPFSCH